MANFRAYIQGRKGPITRLMHRELYLEAQSWSGKITVRLYQDQGVDMCELWVRPHHGKGPATLIYQGPLTKITKKRQKPKKYKVDPAFLNMTKFMEG